ncbi:MAG: single-stranded-DNA-specific exonuclease RecJ [Candidatus Omnitrophota bacterium]
MHSHKVLNIALAQAPLQESLSKELGISKILAQVLINRGLRDFKSAGEFLNIKVDNFLDPSSLPDMDKAVGFLKAAAKNKEKVMICGDYDADGITAVALLKGSLLSQGLDVTHYLPHRIKDGYGLNKNIIRLAKQNNIKILITVDCGISNHKEISELKKNGIATIVTDHHEPASIGLPEAFCIINPKLKDCGYKFRDLAGVGVAYKLCQAMSNSRLLEELDLVALGTIADSVPLKGENRIIAREGLLRFPRTKRPGLQALIENAGLKAEQKFTSTFISFIIGPRINASGRMDTAEESLRLLMSQDRPEAEALAKSLEAFNRQRQKVESRIMGEAEDLINREVNFKEQKIIVIAKEDWHQGVLGIVASKLADKFYRPAIVISLNDTLCKGSARSIKNFHLFEALKECQQFLNAFGGHSHAAGLVISKESIDDFRRHINRLASDALSIEDLLPSIDIDMELSFADINEMMIAELGSLEPFGTGNPEPLFLSRNLKLKSQPQVLGRETLKFWVTDGAFTYQAIGFGMANLKESLIEANSFDLVYTPRLDTWKEESGILLEIEEIFLR